MGNFKRLAKLWKVGPRQPYSRVTERDGGRTSETKNRGKKAGWYWKSPGKEEWKADRQEMNEKRKGTNVRPKEGKGRKRFD